MIVVYFLFGENAKVDIMREVEDKPRVPLKTILQNFLNHVDSMESEKRERDNPFEKEFQVKCRILSLN